MVGDGSVMIVVERERTDGSFVKVSVRNDGLSGYGLELGLADLMPTNDTGVEPGRFRLHITIGGHVLAPYILTILP